MEDFIKTVLWVDDEIETVEFVPIIEDFNEAGIGIDGVTNAKDALKKVRDFPNHYDAIILDALFHFDSSHSSEVAETRDGLRKFLTIYNDEDKIKHIPVFVYSGRVDITLLNVEKEFEQSGIDKVYEKANKESFKTLVQDILNSNVDYLSSRFPKLSKAIKNLGFSYEERGTLNTSLLYIYKNGNNLEGNNLRKILEKLLYILSESKIVPKEIIHKHANTNFIDINPVCFFLNNYFDDKPNKKKYSVSKEIKNVDGYKTCIGHFNNIREVTNSQSHFNTENLVIVKENEISKYSIVIFQIIEIVYWVNELYLLKKGGGFSSEEMWTVEDYEGNGYLHRGIVEKDSDGYFYCDEYYINDKELVKNGIFEGNEILIKKYENNGDFRTKMRYPKYAKSIAKV